MLQVYERAYRLYVVTYKICQMFQSWDKLEWYFKKFIVTVELLYDQAESDFVQCQTKMRAFASRICSEFKQIGLNWNRIVHQNTCLYGVWSSLQPDHETNKSPHRMQVSPPARNDDRSPIWNICPYAPLFEDLLYLFSSEDKYKGVSLYQSEDWPIDWNQLQLCQF